MRRIVPFLAAAMLAAVPGAERAVAAACPVPLPQGADPVTLDPATFTTHIDNPWFPLPAGARWIYRETDPDGGRAKVTVDVLRRTRRIDGVRVRIVRDVVTEHGVPLEKTRDWYAQDACGNVWYLGERTREFEDGEVISTAGSWRSGVDGAFAGVIMPANPQVGTTYREEYLAGEAEDRAEVLADGQRAQVPAGTFRHAILTANTTPVEPRVLEYKLYAPGVGMVLAVGVSGGADREELVRSRLGG